MKFYYYDDDFTRHEITGKTLNDIHAQLCRLLSVGGTRTITAAEAWYNPTAAHTDCRRVTASLYDGDTELIGRNGRNYW